MAPGIDFKFDAIEGYGPDAVETMPHAWQAGAQAKNLKRQLLDMEDGGTFVICPPPNPFRCPPGPYERISMVAHYFKSYKPHSKIIVVDAKNKFSKQKLFEDGWARYFPDMVEWLPLDITGGVKAVDVASNTIIDRRTKSSKPRWPTWCRPRRPARSLRTPDWPTSPAGAPSSRRRWPPAWFPTFTWWATPSSRATCPSPGSRRTARPRSAPRRSLPSWPSKQAFKPRFRNTCWSLITTDDSIKVGANYEATEEKIAKIEGFVSQADESDEVRAQTAAEARAWYDAITADIFG